MVFALSIARASAEDTTKPCAYIGYAFVDGQPVPAGTGIRILEDSTLLKESSTGLWELNDNQFYLDGVVAVPGTEVSFEIWFDGVGVWLPADETAIHKDYDRVEVDLHAWSGAPVTPTATPTVTPLASPTPDATPTPTPCGGGLSGGAIAGIVMGSLIALGLIVWAIRRRKLSEVGNAKS